MIQAVAPNGRWVAACQARSDTDGDGAIQIHFGLHGDAHGDALNLYLMFDDGRELQVDGLAAADPTGRRLVFQRGASLILLDTETRDEVDLSRGRELAKEDANPSMGPRAAHFDEKGAHLVYLEGPDGHERVVVRDLTTQQELRPQLGPGRVWRAELLGDGSWLAVALVTRDTDGNGRLDLPQRATSLAAAHCRGPVSSYFTGRDRGDEVEWRVVRLRDGKVFEEPLVGHGDGVVLLQNTDQSIRWLNSEGDERTTVPASCKAKVFGFWAGNGSVIALCEATNPPSLQLFSRARSRKVDFMPANMDMHLRDPVIHGRVVWILSKLLVDFARGKTYVGAYRGTPAVWQDRVLETLGSGTDRVRDLARGVVAPLAGRSQGQGKQFGRWFVLEQDDAAIVIDLAGPCVAGKLPQFPLVIDAGGMALLPSPTADGIRARALRGPLRWVRPSR